MPGSGDVAGRLRPRAALAFRCASERLGEHPRDAYCGRRPGVQVETPALRRKRADPWRLAWLAAPDRVQLGTCWVVVAAVRCLGPGALGDTPGDTNVSGPARHHASRKSPLSGAGDTRNDSAAPEPRRKHRFAGTSHAGGGTRTPDTRIMIPRRFGSTEPFARAGGHKRGHNGVSGQEPRVKSSWRPSRPALQMIGRLSEPRGSPAPARGPCIARAISEATPSRPRSSHSLCPSRLGLTRRRGRTPRPLRRPDRAARCAARRASPRAPHRSAPPSRLCGSRDRRR